MTMPIDLVLVRHGESEGNVFHGRNAAQYAHLAEEFGKRHSAQWHLTDRGIAQARRAGELLRTHFPGPPFFDRYFTSDYVRAFETAGHLELFDAEWRRDARLVERDWGVLDNLPHDERMRRFADAMARHERESYFWRAEGGERLVDKMDKIKGFFDTLHRECSDKRVVAVCHGEVMHAIRILIERVPPEEYTPWYHMGQGSDWRIPNGGIVHYTRRDPLSGAEATYLNWCRMLTPCDHDPAEPQWSPWRTIVRKRYASRELLDIATADYPPRLVS